ncbi:MAG: glycosyltransferase family 77 protein, partial [Gammaproteobacteria bacterium]
VWCWGFVSLTASEETRRLFDELLRRRANRSPHGAELDDQATCCALIAEDPSWISKAYPLPEGLFVNGLGYKGLLMGEPPAAPLQGALSPFTFHANWTVGLENKRALMRQTGTWLLG